MHPTRISFFGMFFLKFILGDTECPRYKDSIYMSFSFKIIDFYLENGPVERDAGYKKMCVTYTQVSINPYRTNVENRVSS